MFRFISYLEDPLLQIKIYLKLQEPIKALELAK
jgi:hypothetical protein